MFQNTRVTSMETGKIKMENSYEDVDIKDEPLEPDVEYHVSYCEKSVGSLLWR